MTTYKHLTPEQAKQLGTELYQSFNLSNNASDPITEMFRAQFYNALLELNFVALRVLDLDELIKGMSNVIDVYRKYQLMIVDLSNESKQ